MCTWHQTYMPPKPLLSLASCLALVQGIGQAWCTYRNRTMMSPCSPMCTQFLENHSIQSHMLIEERQTSQMSQPNLSLSTGETTVGKESRGPHPGPPTPPDALPDQGLPPPRCHLAAMVCVLGSKAATALVGELLPLSHRPPHLHLGGKCSLMPRAAEGPAPRLDLGGIERWVAGKWVGGCGFGFLLPGLRSGSEGW